MEQNYLQVMKHCVITDVDGTIADGRHRQHLIKGPGKKNWPAYQKLAYDDAPIWPVINAFRLLSEKMPAFILSGRGEHEREITTKWLWDKAQIYPKHYNALYMRPNRDSRNDALIKEEILKDKIQAEGFWPQFVFDDRPRVIRRWREMGIFVFNCDQEAYGPEF